jgi:hypothetical protein
MLKLAHLPKGTRKSKYKIFHLDTEDMRPYLPSAGTCQASLAFVGSWPPKGPAVPSDNNGSCSQVRVLDGRTALVLSMKRKKHVAGIDRVPNTTVVWLVCVQGRTMWRGAPRCQKRE